MFVALLANGLPQELDIRPSLGYIISEGPFKLSNEFSMVLLALISSEAKNLLLRSHLKPLKINFPTEM